MEAPDSKDIFSREKDRLEAVKAYQILKALPEAVFQELVQLTATIFEMPVAFLSLVEEKQVWFQICVGLEGIEYISREQTLCPLSIMREGVTIFPDLLLDGRALIDPTLVDILALRFYAGATLVTNAGYQIGVLCVVDYQPRQLAAQDAELLQALAKLALVLMDLHYNAAHSANNNPAFDNELSENIEQSINWMKKLASQILPTTAARLAERKQAIHKEAVSLVQTIKQGLAIMQAGL